MSDAARWMNRALSLAARGLGNTWPNPAVGCVLVRDGAVIGEGWTQPGGRPHAEVEALTGVDARGATAYVTLEPCAHTGQTGPCAVALVEAGVARVVLAVQDPDPRVAGRGRAILEAAGVAVEVGLMQDDATTLNRGFFSRILRGRPWITLKLASSLDGRIALANGESRWITGPEARGHVHGLRAAADAVLIGAGTARADDPMLNVRAGSLQPRQPVRVVTDPSLSIPPAGKLAQTAHQQPVWLLHSSARDAPPLRDAGVQLFEVPSGPGGLDLTVSAQVLGQQGLTRVLCEGGGRLAAGLIKAGLVDELILITAGKVIGSEGVPNIGPMLADVLADVPRFYPVEQQMLGQDVLTRWLNPATDVQGS
ncbi:MAG: bifunctional diaminohydroxyphosphoribosylaminopyrimidine deaminase/5-amino-6-(5-phosphoribosylamino)uracil reductase RibD [Pseudomonadota bacterium]